MGLHRTTALDYPLHRQLQPERRSAGKSSGRHRYDGDWSVCEMSAVKAPVEVPEAMVERVGAICLVLPEVTVRVDHSLTRVRSTAQSFDIRRRSFCLLVAVEDPTGKPTPLLVLRVDPDEREALRSIGHPVFVPRARRDRIGVLLTHDTDWGDPGARDRELPDPGAEEAHRTARVARARGRVRSDKPLRAGRRLIRELMGFSTGP